MTMVIILYIQMWLTYKHIFIRVGHHLFKFQTLINCSFDMKMFLAELQI